jgi:hypothetical protein
MEERALPNLDSHNVCYIHPHYNKKLGLLFGFYFCYLLCGVSIINVSFEILDLLCLKTVRPVHNNSLIEKALLFSLIFWNTSGCSR